MPDKGALVLKVTCYLLNLPAFLILALVQPNIKTTCKPKKLSNVTKMNVC